MVAVDPEPVIVGFALTPELEPVVVPLPVFVAVFFAEFSLLIADDRLGRPVGADVSAASMPIKRKVTIRVAERSGVFRINLMMNALTSYCVERWKCLR